MFVLNLYSKDKNRDNAETAAEKFMLVTKAYQALSSPEAMENLEKFGSFLFLLLKWFCCLYLYTCRKR